jgi:hypothetical protein
MMPAGSSRQTLAAFVRQSGSSVLTASAALALDGSRHSRFTQMFMQSAFPANVLVLFHFVASIPVISRTGRITPRLHPFTDAIRKGVMTR